MDLTTLVLVITTAIAALGLDAIWHPRDIVLETVSTGKLEKTSMDASLARSVVQDEVARISATPTLMSKPLIRWQHQGGIAVVQKAANLLEILEEHYCCPPCEAAACIPSLFCAVGSGICG